MAAAVTYTNFGGMLVHENRGGVETEYVNDTLGSLVECRDASGTKTYEATYWPYGEIRTSTGTNPSPWAFVGLLGYLRETSSRTYVRARYYRQEIARWMTVDPLWPRRKAFVYCRSVPTGWTDRSGLGVTAFVSGSSGAAAATKVGGAKLGGAACGSNPVGWIIIATIGLCYLGNKAGHAIGDHLYGGAVTAPPVSWEEWCAAWASLGRPCPPMPVSCRPKVQVETDPLPDDDIPFPEIDNPDLDRDCADRCFFHCRGWDTELPLDWDCIEECLSHCLTSGGAWPPPPQGTNFAIHPK